MEWTSIVFISNTDIPGLVSPIIQHFIISLFEMFHAFLHEILEEHTRVYRKELITANFFLYSVRTTIKNNSQFISLENVL